MKPDRSRIAYLLQHYRNNTCTNEEFTECLQYLGASKTYPILLEWMEEEWGLMTDQPLEIKNISHLYPDIHPVKIRRITWLRIAAAVSVVLFISLGIIYFHPKRAVTPITPEISKTEYILPGGNRAVLTLGNGTKILLDTANIGAIAQQLNAQIIKSDSGRLDYQASVNFKGQSVLNTLSTPRGGQFELRLPDGTRVWLNSASSITYPTAFIDNSRNVSITGEAYFEVAKDKTKPFQVSIGDMKIAVLGTHFNINAYNDEIAINTTLLEGSVKLSWGNQSRILSPGEQSSINKEGNIKISEHVDTEQVIAWKSGFFEFDNMDLPTIMRQVSRWYDVGIIFETNYPDARFGGRVSRQLKLSEILQLLELSGVHFKLENNTLTIVR